MKKLLLLTILYSFFSSCKKDIQQTEKDVKKPELNIAVNHPKPDLLDIYSEVEIENWNEYSNLSSYLERFDKISPNEALNNAIELKDLVKSLKDSIKPAILDNNAFNARVNVLQNETLRLTDMTYIPSIKAEEVNNQIVKILDVFGSINQKINTIYSQKRFEDAVKVNEGVLKTDSIIKPGKSVKPKKNRLKNKTLIGEPLDKKGKRKPLLKKTLK